MLKVLFKQLKIKINANKISTPVKISGAIALKQHQIHNKLV